MNLRDELIQVAAVAVAIVEDIDSQGKGTRSDEWTTQPVLADVHVERDRQEELWGQQHHNMAVWMTILGEEYGEACKVALDEWIIPPEAVPELRDSNDVKWSSPPADRTSVLKETT